MFCPRCGAPRNPESKFCGSCGYNYSDHEPAPQQTEYSEPITHEPAVEPVANTEVLKEQPVAFEAYPPIEEKKGFFSRKKNVVILVVALVAVAAACVAGALMFFGKNIEKAPTQYALNSVGKYFESTAKNDDAFTLLSKSDDQALFKGSFDGDFSGQKLTFDVQSSANAKTKEFSFNFNGDIPNVGELAVDLFGNTEKLEAAYNIGGKRNDVYVSLKDFAEQIKKSPFAPDSDNLLGLTEKQFNDFLKNYETFYNNCIKSNKYKEKYEEALVKLCAAFEKYGNVKVTGETINVNGKDVSTDVITYTFDKESLQSFSDEATQIINDTLSTIVGTADIDAKEELDEGIKTELADMDIVVSAYVDKNGEIARINASATHDNQTEKLTLDFSREPDTVVSINFVPSSGEDFKAVLSRKEDSGKVTYKLELPALEYKTSVSLELDKAAKEYTVSIASGGQKLGFSGAYEVTDNSVTLTFDSKDFPMLASSGSDFVVKLTFGNKAEIKKVDSKNNLLTMSKEKLQELVQNLVPASSNPMAYGIQGYDDDDLDDYDFDDDDPDDYSDLLD